MTRGLQVYAARQHMVGNRIGLHFARPTERGWEVVKPVELAEVENDLETMPALSLRPEEAQQLMDELWKCGLRPSEGSGSAGSLAATERHLADMRALAFAKLEVPKP